MVCYAQRTACRLALAGTGDVRMLLTMELTATAAKVAVATVLFGVQAAVGHPPDVCFQLLEVLEEAQKPGFLHDYYDSTHLRHALLDMGRPMGRHMGSILYGF